ncbi:MAG: type III pantothenate kinase [Bacteroidota bacterium]
MILAIDIGNTRAKIGVCSSTELEEVLVTNTNNLADFLTNLLQEMPPSLRIQIAWTSVSRIADLSDLKIWQRFERHPYFLPINQQTSWPIVNKYASPETLGTDRIVGVIGARAIQPEGPILLIDAGTALTFELLDRDNHYLGGGISPGIQMRLRSLHEFTARLPLITATPAAPLVGNTTESCIQAGVVGGIFAEVKGLIQQYRSHFGEDLSVFLTGGDMSYFEKLGKNINFADPNLILRGIHFILMQQLAQ